MTDGRTTGLMGVSQYPSFFFEERGENNMTVQHNDMISDSTAII